MNLTTLSFFLATAMVLITPATAAEPVNNVKKSAPALPASTGTNLYTGGDKADEVCTTEPQSEWLPVEEMKLLATHRGYRIKTFKISKNNCYEVYGFDRQGQIVEAYFNPVTSRLVSQNIAR
jgi:hypothetical protein